MSFGFLVEKFSLFLWAEMGTGRPSRLASLATSNLLGVMLVGMGAFLGLFSLLRYVRVQKEIENNEFRPSIVLDVLCGLIIFALSGTLFYYILDWHNILIMQQAPAGKP